MRTNSAAAEFSNFKRFQLICSLSLGDIWMMKNDERLFLDWLTDVRRIQVDFWCSNVTVDLEGVMDGRSPQEAGNTFHKIYIEVRHALNILKNWNDSFYVFSLTDSDYLQLIAIK